MVRIVCIGAGRLANQLMPVLSASGASIVQVYNRTLSGAEALAHTLGNIPFTNQIEEISQETDLYFFPVSDDAVGHLAAQLIPVTHPTALYVHTSGILPLTVLPFENHGVFYPLQTFSANHAVDWKQTPILITANTPEATQTLLTIAHNISEAVYQVSDADKSVLHLSAVFANNFVNHMLTIAEGLCKEHGVSFDILKPLIRETIEKALVSSPSMSQTGPAIRGDQQTIERHLQQLSHHPALSLIYTSITRHITELYQIK